MEKLDRDAGMEDCRATPSRPVGGFDAQTGMSVSRGGTGMAVSPTVVTRRNLPHWRRDGALYSITFRLADALPQARLVQLREEKEVWLKANPLPWAPEQEREYGDRFGERVQEWLDAGYGCCALARPEVRDVVQACLTRFDGQRLHLHAAVIMPNHVHAMIEPIPTGDTGIPAGGSEAQTGMSVSLFRSKGHGGKAGGVD